MRTLSFLALVTVAAVAAACGGQPEPEQPAPMPAVDSTAIRERMRQDSIDAARRAAEEAAEALRTDLASMIHFDYNVADIRPQDQAVLDRKAAIMQANPALRMRVSGHADERGSDEYNLALGNRRAASAKRYLANRGIDGGRIEVLSYGEERPLAMGGGEAAWAQNRRAEFEVTAGGDNLAAPQ
jgi:peptidoglycan-associated lipoprotein